MRHKRIYVLKKAFTMIEVITVVAVIGLLALVAFSKLKGSPDNAEITSTLDSDAESLYNGMARLKNDDIAAAGTFAGTSTQKASHYIDNPKMVYNATTDTISSSGLNGGCAYKLGSSEVSNQRWELFMDCSSAATNKQWSNKQKMLAEIALANKMTSLVTTAADKSTSMALGCSQTALPTTAYTASSTTAKGGVTLGAVTSDCATLTESAADGKIGIININ